MPQFFAIIVHYGSPEPTMQAIEHLLAGRVPPAQILVIDHATTPFHYAFSGRGRVIRPTHNTGYAAGINIGLGALAALGATFDDVVIGMNNDVLVQPDTLAAIQKWRNTHPRAALAGVIADEGAMRVYGGGRINKWTGRAVLNATPSKKIDYIHGAFLVAPYRVFLQAQGLPEEYFLYWEDVAFSYALRRRHIPLEVIPTARVVHTASSAHDVIDDRHLYYLVRNGALFLEQHLPWPWRKYWQLRNFTRRWYHGRRRGGATVVWQGLTDARAKKTGPHAFLSPTAHAN